MPYMSYHVKKSGIQIVYSAWVLHICRKQINTEVRVKMSL